MEDNGPLFKLFELAEVSGYNKKIIKRYYYTLTFSTSSTFSNNL